MLPLHILSRKLYEEYMKATNPSSNVDHEQVPDYFKAARTLKADAFSKSVLFSFPTSTDVALRLVGATPNLDVDFNTKDLKCDIFTTANDLSRYINMEQCLARSLEIAHTSDKDNVSEIDESLSEISSSIVSAEKTSESNVLFDQALDRLQFLADDCMKADNSVHSLNESLKGIILSTWPRKTLKRACCFQHKAYEIGARMRPCPFGFRCDFRHALLPCKDFSNCTHKKCAYLHSSEMAMILLLDTRLNDIYKSQQYGGSFSDLCGVLSKHRSEMLHEAEILLEEANHRENDIQAELAELKAVVTSTTSDAELKERNIEALSSKLDEVSCQIKEFQKSNTTFSQSDEHSFTSCRLFAREVYNRFKTRLPIYAEKQTILDATEQDFAVLILSAETGSGKSTQVVQYINEVVEGKVLCTQPRRVAAISLADRVAEEMQTKPPTRDSPNLVTCRGSGSKHDQSRSKIQFLTDASLLNQLYYNPTLPNVSAVVVDEVHERSINTDLVISLLRRTLQLRSQQGRHPFKLVLTSATMNEALFAKYFARNNWDMSSPSDQTWAPVLKVGGRTYPVTIHFDAKGSQSNYEKEAELKAIALSKELPLTNLSLRQNYDILVFLSQADEVDRLTSNLQAQLPHCFCVALHGSLERDEQTKAFQKIDPNQYERKIVVSTNIAETSVTIDGIGAVIDTGYSKQATYDSSKDATVLKIDFIAKSSAKQRAGRAGRTAAGDCYRLYSKEEYEDMNDDQPAELLRSEATSAILSVLWQIQKQTEWIQDIRAFPFVEHPGEQRLEVALKTLYHLGAIDSIQSSKLTSFGQKMAKMSTSPKVSAILFKALQLNVLDMACIAVNMAGGFGNILRRGKDEDKGVIRTIRASFANKFVDLGDIGSAVAIYLAGKQQAHRLKEWCNENFVNIRALRECMKQMRSMFNEMTDVARGMNIDDVDLSNNATDWEEKRADNAIDAITEESFQNKERVSLMLQSLMAGYFANLAFFIPPRDSSVGLPQYFLPGPDQMGSLTSTASFGMSTNYPNVCIYMEIVENKKLYVMSMFGVDESVYSSYLPETFRNSDVFKNYVVMNARKQFLSRPAVATTTCSIAFKKFVGNRVSIKSKLAALTKEYREMVKLDDAEEFILDADCYSNSLLIYCANNEKSEIIRSIAEAEFEAIRIKLEKRLREWVIPNTSARAVCSIGGVCKEIMLNSSQSICVRFTANSLSERLSEPISTLDFVPEGFFRTLVETSPDRYDRVSDAEVDRVCGHTYYLQACEKKKYIYDLRSASVGQVQAAISYTGGGDICYRVNAYLRSCNGAECEKYASYIYAMIGFHKKRSQHPTNKRGDIVVYRGCSMSTDLFLQYVPGKTIIWPSFTSTSTDLSVAKSFSRKRSDDEISVVFEISTSLNCPLQDLSVYPGESEILMSCFSMLHVQCVDTRDDKKYVRMTQVFEMPVSVVSGKTTEEPDLVDGTGPFVFKVTSTLPGEAGLAEEIQKQLVKLDMDADIDVMYDLETKRLWGRVFFSSSELAGKACSLLNRSILGDRELSVRTAPVSLQNDSLHVRFKVNAVMSAIPLSGFVEVDCGSEDMANQLLGPKVASGTGKTKKWNSVQLPSGTTVQISPCTSKDGSINASRVTVKFTDEIRSQSHLQAELKTMFPSLPADGVKHFQKDAKKAKEEVNALKKTGVRGTRDRIAYISSIASDGMEYIEEIGFHNGAQYALWYSSLANAAHSALKLNKTLTPMPGTALKCSATIDSSTEIIFSDEVVHLLRDHIEYKVNALRSEMEPSVCIKLRNFSPKSKSLRCTISGYDIPMIAVAYKQLNQLQCGTMINISIDDRCKIFPSFQSAQSVRSRVSSFLKMCGERNHCIISPLPMQSCIKVVGEEESRSAVAKSVHEFLAESKYSCCVKINPKQSKAIKEVIHDADISISIDGKFASIESHNLKKLQDAKCTISTVGNLFNSYSGSVCCLCSERSDQKLGTCGHVLCQDCCIQYYNASIQENRVPLRCVEPSCGKELLIEDLVKITDNVDAVYNAGVVAHMMQRPDKFSKCHTPECPQILDNSVDAVLCQRCMSLQCPRCGLLPHKGESCEERRYASHSDSRIGDDVGKSFIDKSLYPICPACHSTEIEFSGSLGFTCSACPSTVVSSAVELSPLTPAASVAAKLPSWTSPAVGYTSGLTFTPKTSTVFRDSIPPSRSARSEINLSSYSYGTQVGHAKQLDLVFCLDCTGSMGSVIKACQSSIVSLTNTIITSEKQDVRVSFIPYRDHRPCEEFCTKVYPFTRDVRQMQKNVNEQSPNGGEDFPEAVTAAMFEALTLDWRVNAAKVVIFMADAPPHGISDGDDTYHNGDPDGKDPLVIAREMISLGISVYSIVAYSGSSSVQITKDFFATISSMTGGQCLNLADANFLLESILTSVQENIDMESKMMLMRERIEALASERGSALTITEIESMTASISESAMKSPTRSIPADKLITIAEWKLEAAKASRSITELRDVWSRATLSSSKVQVEDVASRMARMVVARETRSHDRIIVESIVDHSHSYYARIVSPGYDQNKRCEFPYDVKVPSAGKQFLVDGIVDGGTFYRIVGNITLI